ncbi:putative alpha-amylase [Dioscorea sansibarensis]
MISAKLLFLLLAFASSSVNSQLLFQGFNWESWRKQGGWYNSLKDHVSDIAAAGVSHVWLPPPSHSVSEQGFLIYIYIYILYYIFQKSTWKFSGFSFWLCKFRKNKCEFLI